MQHHHSLNHRTTRRRALTGIGATLAPLLLAGAGPGLAKAQRGTPVPAAQASPEIVYSVQYTHIEKIYFYIPAFAEDTFLAAIHGTDVETYLAIRADFEMAVHEVAGEMLADGAFAEKVDALPFEPGSVVTAIGESDTDDLQSWFEILRHLVTMRRPDDGMTFVNQGISGQNTSQALGQIGVALTNEPAWLLCLLGGNDVLRNGPDAKKTEVSIEETEKNLVEMRRLAAAANDPEWVWLTRPPIDETRSEVFPGFQMGNIAFQNADVERVNAFITSQPEPVVDIYAAFGEPATEFLGPDGVHASLEGQAAIARAVVEQLAG